MKVPHVQPAPMKRLSTVIVPPDAPRISTGLPSLDTCLAGSDEEPAGLPEGASVLISGAPGGGKSTLAALMANASALSLILHGEEPERNVKKRWERLKLTQDPYLASLRDVEVALDNVRDAQANLVVVDSVQTLVREGKRRHDYQAMAAEELVGTICGSGGVAVLVCHVSKDGTAHAGDQSLAHLVDVHLHVTTNAKKGERKLEIRKNRHGRAGFEVPLTITQFGVDVGTPSAMGSLASARSGLEKAAEKAIELLLIGKTLTGYDFDLAGVSGGIWRAGLEMGAKRLQRDGKEIECIKVQGRRGFRIKVEGPLPEGAIVIPFPVNTVPGEEDNVNE
jgi:hypothetical protein